MNTFFPIKKDPACLLKWSQVSLYLYDNTASSCHRNKSHSVPDDYDFHNAPIQLEHRQKMLNGQWPADGRGCEHCRDQEQFGGVSDRIQWLSSTSNERYVPKELYQDPTLLKVKPTQISVHFNNKCNLKCLYCGPELSSSWMKEKLKYEQGVDYGLDPWLLDTTYKDRLAKFYAWMEQNYSSLKAFDILGGEPFIQPECFDCIDWMIAHPNPDCDVEIYSNFQVKHELFKKNMEKVRQLAGTVREVCIVASIDCYGPAAEYIRYGHDWATFEQNWLYFLQECPEVKSTMNWTITSLSIPYTAELMRKIIVWDKEIRKTSVNLNKCVDPIIYDPHIMPQGFYAKHIEEILQLADQMSSNDVYKKYVQGIFNEIDQSPAMPEKIKELKQRLTVLDGRRGTDWKVTFPWLVDIS